MMGRKPWNIQHVTRGVHWFAANWLLVWKIRHNYCLLQECSGQLNGVYYPFQDSGISKRGKYYVEHWIL